LKDEGEEGLEKKFKMNTFISTSNMVYFDGRGRIKKYNSSARNSMITGSNN